MAITLFTIFPGLRGHDRDARPSRHEPVQAGGRRRAFVPLPRQRSLPKPQSGEDGISRSGGGHTGEGE